MSDRNSWREIPVRRSTSSTRSAGTRPLSHLRTVVLFTPKGTARSDRDSLRLAL